MILTIAILIVSLLWLLMGSTINRLQKIWLTEPMIALLTGIVAGPVLHLIKILEMQQESLLEWGAKLTIAMALMACSCPVVSTDVGDVRQIINDTKGCFICEPTVADVREKVRKAIPFRQTRRRERMPFDYRKETVTRNIIQKYNSLVD